MNDLYVYTHLTDEQAVRYNSTKPLREQPGMNHFETRHEAVEYLDQHCRGLIEKARRAYEKLKNKHLEFLNDNRD